MKKLLIIILSIFSIMCITNLSEAKTIKMIGTTLNDFSTINKTENLKVELLGTKETPDGKYIPAGTILSGEMVKFVKAKRGKRDAYAFMKINSYKIPHENEYRHVNNANAIVKISKYEELDLLDKGLDIGASAAGLFIENITYPINFVRGVIEADDDENKLKAGVQKTYEKSFFSFVSKGKELHVPTGYKLTVTFTFDADKND